MAKFAFLVILVAACALSVASASHGAESHSQSDVLEIKYNEKKLRTIRETKKNVITVKVMNCTEGGTLAVTSMIPEEQHYIATVSQTNYTITCDEEIEDLYNSTIELNVTVHGWFIGLTKLTLTVDFNGTTDTTTYQVGVLRKPSKLDVIFQFGILGFVCLVTLGFGATLDLEVVKKILKRPIAPVTGLICQYTLMPVGAYVLGVIFQLNSAFALGLFAMGAAPGGGPSNIWSLLLGGSVDLSITMTFFSAIMCFAMYPFWMYTLGSVLTREYDVTIPFINIFTTILVVVVPLGVGVLINRFLPRVSRIIAKILKPVAAIFIIFVFSFGMYTNRYIFTVLGNEWRIYLSGILLPNVGMGLAFLVAFLLRQERPFIITIGLEVAIQNTAVAIVFLQNTLPQPLADLSLIMPLIASMFQPIIFITTLGIRTVYLKCKGASQGADISLEKTDQGSEVIANKGAVDADDIDIEPKKLNDVSQTQANGKTTHEA